MKNLVSRGRLSVLVACLSSMPALLFAARPDAVANLSACKNGWPTCDRTRLTLVEMTQVTLAGRARNISHCRNGMSSCDLSKLSAPEAIAVTAALYDRNLSNCTAACLNDRGHCDRSRRWPSEVAAIPPEVR